MSLLRFPLRPAASIGSQCSRCFTTTTPHAQQSQSSSQGILDILAERPTNNSSFRNAAGSSSSSTALRFARAAGMDRPQEQTREFVEAERRVAFQRQIFRRYQPGDVYSPHDLSGAEQKKWKTGRKKPTQDAFDVLGINPVNEYKNFTVMSEYMTEMGRIKHSRDTGLRPKNQRKIAKAIRRAIGLGLMPSVHRHPLVVKNSHPSRFQ